MGLNQDSFSRKNLDIVNVERVEYFDSRYYKVTYLEAKKKMQVMLTSVTEFLGALPKDFLPRWRGDVGNERADQIIIESQRLGSFVHWGAEVIGRRGAVIYNPQENPIYSDKEMEQLKRKHKVHVVCRYQAQYVQLWRIFQWFERVRPTGVQTEQTVYSLEHKFAGTLDAMGTIEAGDYEISGSKPLHLEGGDYIWDYKSGKGVDKSYKMQVAAYLKGVFEGLDPKLARRFKGALIVHSNSERTEKGIEGLQTHLVTVDECREYFEQFKKVQQVYWIDKPHPTPTQFSMPTVLSISSLLKRKKGE